MPFCFLPKLWQPAASTYFWPFPDSATCGSDKVRQGIKTHRWGSAEGQTGGISQALAVRGWTAALRGGAASEEAGAPCSPCYSDCFLRDSRAARGLLQVLQLGVVWEGKEEG